MPKNTETSPITPDKPNIPRKSLPLYKKTQYFVQANRGWVMKISALFALSSLVILIFFFQDRIFDFKPKIYKINTTSKVNEVMKEMNTFKVVIDADNYDKYPPLTKTTYWERNLNEKSGKDENGKIINTENATLVKVIKNLDANYILTVNIMESKTTTDIIIDSNTSVYMPTYIIDKASKKIESVRIEKTENTILQSLGNGSILSVRYYEDSYSRERNSILANELLVAEINI